MTDWGFKYIDGVEFFIEAGRPKPPFYPDNLPKTFCPHKTEGEPVKFGKPLGIYFYEQGYRFPENVFVEGSRIIYTGLSCLSIVKTLLKQTNYIPLVIDGFKIDGKQDRFLTLLYNEVMLVGRSVVLTGDKFIPLPCFVERVK